jgi:hypothetical protein
VTPTGDDANDGSSWALAKQTIAEALDAAEFDDEIWVKAGTYTENIALWSGMKLYGGFAGTEGDDEFALRDWTANETILDGGSIDSVVTVETSAVSTTRIDGFTIQNGDAYDGGGIYCDEGSAPTICNNLITGNEAETEFEGEGGGIYCDRDCEALISNNVITYNDAVFGGGIACDHCSPTIKDNVISGNYADEGGGGIDCFSVSTPKIYNNTIVGNDAADHGGGIFNETATSVIANNIIAYNSSGIEREDTETSIVTIINNCVYDNGTNYILLDPEDYPTDIQDDPEFVNPGGWVEDEWVEPEGGGDYHLTAGSPCIDVGEDDVVEVGDLDMDSQPRVLGPHVDMGADEYKKHHFDIDGNYADDLVGLTAAGKIYYSTNKSSWVNIPGILSGLAVGDFNGDGYDDIGGLNSAGKVYYTTDASTWTRITAGTLSANAGLTAADLDGDGSDDFAGVTSAGKIYYTTNKTSWTNIPGTLAGLGHGDFNGDGWEDIGGSNTAGKVYYTTNLTSWINTNGIMSRVAVGDLNGDGSDDVAGVNANGSVWYSTDKTTWTRITGTLADIAIGDLNGDGTDDIIGLNAAGKIYYTTNLSTWTNILGTLSSLAIGDFNGDGSDDIAGLSATGKIYYTTNKTSWTNITGTLAQLYSAR